jgi:prohibitin 2
MFPGPTLRNQLVAVGSTIVSLATLYKLTKSSLYFVDTGHQSIKFNKFTGVGSQTFKEGYHLMIPWFERPIIYNV